MKSDQNGRKSLKDRGGGERRIPFKAGLAPFITEWKNRGREGESAQGFGRIRLRLGSGKGDGSASVRSFRVEEEIGSSAV